MRIGFRIVKDSRFLRSTEITDISEDTRTHKILRALEEACREFDLPRPIWLDSTIADFKRRHKTRFGQDSFIEELPFDWLEIEVLEED